jgi:hypothetical protein
MRLIQLGRGIGAVLLLLIAPPARAATEADVVVYGSTPGGFCAAIAAAREGASVILLEPTDHVGAMSTGGLSHCDSNQMVRGTLMGLFDEWHTRVVKDYTDRGHKAPYNPALKDQSVWVFEPHVAMRVTKKMLDEAGVKLLVNERLKSVKTEDRRIVSLVTKNGAFNAKVYVDGTYEGDLMAEAGIDWTIGREGRAEYNEPLAGKRYPKKKMEINGFDDRGKLLPLLTTDDGGKDEAGDQNIMTYSFRLCLTANPQNRVPMPKPDKYDPARFEIIRRYLKAGGDVKQLGFDLYPLPGDKLDGNNSIGRQFSMGLVGGGNEWHKADEAGRKAIREAHKQYTLEFYQFLTADPAVPQNIQNTYARLGLCKDEFANDDHFSPALYVRESRRMKGLYVISQKDILNDPKKDDPIAVSSFPIDSHDVQRIAIRGGGVINEGTIFPVRRTVPKQGYAYHVPYRSILPKPEACHNLLVPVALSCTHVGMSSLRIEGAWMVIGQGAGVAAALAVKEKVTVQGVPYEKLRERLRAQGQVLDLPAPPNAKSRTTSVSIDKDKFFINGQPTYKGRTWNGKPIEGLLMNSRTVQATFDDRNPDTVARWVYPDTKTWDADRNTAEFIEMMPTWRKHGLLAVTLNLQGGSPEGYSKSQPWHNSAVNADGTLDEKTMARLAKVIDKADELGMVVILGLYYFGQDERLKDEKAVIAGVDAAVDWLIGKKYTNVLVEVNNECNVRYDHAILKPDRVHELIGRVKARSAEKKHPLLAGTSYGGNTIPKANVVNASDFLLLHGNGVKEPKRIAEMVQQTRKVDGYRPMPILFNEDDHFDFDKPENNFKAAVNENASWGYFDFRMKGEGFDEGYQSVPVNWKTSSGRKKGFFKLLSEITGEKP